MHENLIKTLTSFKKIVFVGGGTGGHIQPILSVKSFLEKAYPYTDDDFIWIGKKSSLEQESAKKAHIPFSGISVLKLSSTLSPKVLLYPLYLLKSYFDAKKILKNIRKNAPVKERMCVFSKGGPGALAIGLAAVRLKIPLYIHESDTIPGTSNRFLGRFATKTFLGFGEAERFFPNKQTFVIGQILDPLLFGKTQNSETPAVCWHTKKRHILVFCGSQGARAILLALCENLGSLIEENEWIIVLGKLNKDLRPHFEAFKKKARASGLDADIQVLDWLEKKDQRNIFLSTNLAITRASATTLAELDMFGIKKIIIPLPLAAKNHQYENAQIYKKRGDILLEQKNIEELLSLLEAR